MRPRITFANVVSLIALFVALGGTAIATHPGGANTISSADIIDNTVRTDDIRDANLRTADIDTSAIISSKVADGSLTDADTSGLVPYGDVLWAVVNSDGSLSRASNATTTSIREGAGSGDYEVDFGSGSLDPCASIAQISSFHPEFAGFPGQAASAQGVDSGDDIDVRTFDSAGAAADRGFTVHVLCPEEVGGGGATAAKSADRGRR